MDKFVKVLDLNGRAVLCEFQRKRVKRTNVHVRRDGTLYCSIPIRGSFIRAEEFVSANAEYLLRGIDRTLKAQVNDGTPKLFITGEDIKIFGERKALKIEEGRKNTAEETSDSLIVTVKDPSDKDMVKRTYTRWRKENLKKAVDDFACELYPYFASYGAKFPEQIRYGDYKSFWGICYPKRSLIKFSLRLNEQDPELIRYVVAHEFSHLVEANHSDRFWKLLTGIIPNARACQKKLLLKD